MTFRGKLRSCVAAVAIVTACAAGAAPPRDGLAAARLAIARGDGIAAEIVVAKAVAAGRPRREVAAMMGEALLLQDRLADARQWLGPAQFDPSSRQRGYHALARLELAEQDYAAAARAFNHALASGAPQARLWVDIGAMRYRSGEQRLALDAARRALAIDPRDPAALGFRAQLVRDAEGPAAALGWYARATRQAPDDLGLLAGYAESLGDAGRNRDMLAVARRMVAVDPRDPRAYFFQAVLAARGGQFGLARRLMWKTRGTYEDKPAGLLLNGILELAGGSAALAVEHFDTLLRTQPENRVAGRLLARALLANGEPNEVVARFGPAAARAHAAPYVLAVVGRAHEHRGDRAGGTPYLERAAAAWDDTLAVLPVDDAGDFAIWQREKGGGGGLHGAVPLLRRLIASHRFAEARAEAAALQARYPQSTDVDRLAGDVALLTGDARGAAAAFDNAATVRTDDALMVRRFYADRALGRDPLPSLDAYLRGSPRSASALRVRGWWANLGTGAERRDSSGQRARTLSVIRRIVAQSGA